MIRKVLTTALLGAFAIGVGAGSPTMETVWGKDEIILKTGDSVTAEEFAFPAVRAQRDKRLCLAFSAFFQVGVPGGWNPYLGIALNGKDVGKTCPGGNRILNKPDAFDSDYGKIGYWGKRGGMDLLLTAFGDGKQIDKRIKGMASPEIYDYVLDVSDMVNYLETGADNRILNDSPNRIKLSNFLLKKYMESSTPYPLVIKDLRLGFLPEQYVKEKQVVALAKFKADNILSTTDMGKYSFSVTASGGMEIKQNGFRWFVDSSFSYPADKIGWRAFSVDPVPGDTWKLTIFKEKPDSLVINGTGKPFNVTRSIRLLADKISVADTITNTSDATIGSIAKNTLVSEKIPGKHYLSGASDTNSFKLGSSENPSVFVAAGDGGLGLLAEDNVYRCHLRLSALANAFTMEDPYFSLAPGKSYERQWTIYLVDKGDYWTFINRVRHDWNVNFTVDGPFEFGMPNPARQSAVYTANWKDGGWFEYSLDGINTSREAYKQAAAKNTAVVKKQLPQAKCLGNLETNLYTLRREDISGGELLPGTFPDYCDKNAVMGGLLNKEQTALLEKLPIADSVLRGPDGNMRFDTFFAKKSLNLLIYPEKGNYSYRRILEQVDFLLDDVGLDGIYFDQFSLGWDSPTRADRRTFHRGDGHSAEIDPQTGKVTRTYTDCSLAGAEARADILKHILAKGKIAVCNTLPTVRETQSLPVARFIEGDSMSLCLENYADSKPPLYENMTKAHLGSPVMLGIRPNQEAAGWPNFKDELGKAFYKGVIAGLRNGLLYYYYFNDIPGKYKPTVGCGPIIHMFPFTPVEINEGFLVGKERIITCVSRKFTFPTQGKPVCLLFDENGVERKNNWNVTSGKDGWEIDVKLNDWNEIAVIEVPTEAKK